MKNKRGISLIILIITIIVVIILASVVILTISKNNPLNSAKEANFKSDVRNFQDDLAIYVGNQILTDYNGTREKITTSENPNVDEIKNYIASFTKKYEGKLGIEEDELVYFPKGVTKEEKKWLEDLGIKAKALKATDESEFNWKSNDPNNSEYGTITSYKGTSVNVVIPERCTEIKLFSFKFNSNIESITLTKNVKFLSGEFIYSGCDKLVTIDVVDDNPYFSSQDGVLFNKNKTNLIRFPQGSKVKEYKIPDTVTCLGKSAFYDCNNLENIIIPNTVEKLDRYAISSCDNIKNITIPESVTEIDFGLNNENNFSFCENLTDINVVSNNKYFCSENGILFNKSKTSILKFPCNKNISNYVIPESVTYIEKKCFESCKNIDSVIIPNSVTYINYGAFNQSSLKNIIIPESIKGIEWEVFAYCNKLTEITLPEGLTTISWEAFKGCGNLEKIILPQSLTSISNDSFRYCNKLTFYCRIKEEDMSSGWKNGWNYSRPIVWEYTGN